jgi:hypothetical protein
LALVVVEALVVLILVQVAMVEPLHLTQSMGAVVSVRRQFLEIVMVAVV